MKIYLFCLETGLYQGEDFTDDNSINLERDGLPAGATSIAPPDCSRGQVPVFLASENRWYIGDASRFSEAESARMRGSALAANID